jgi:hypothetical protein
VDDSLKRLAELRAQQEKEKDKSSFAPAAIAPVMGAIMVRNGVLGPSGKPIQTVDDVVEYVKANSPLYHGTSKSRALDIHKTGLYPEGTSGAVSTYDLDPEWIEENRHKIDPVSFMADKPSLGYAETSLAVEKGKSPFDNKAVSAKEMKKGSAIHVIPRSDDIYWNKPNDSGERDIRRSTDVDTPYRNYSEGLDNNPYIERGDFFSPERQSPDITLTEDDAVELVKRMNPEDHTYARKFGSTVKRTAKKAASVLPFIGPAFGLGAAALSQDANAAIPVLNEAESLGPVPGSDDWEIENPQRNPQLRQQALQRLLKK